jgi:hypothetical protein
MPITMQAFMAIWSNVRPDMANEWYRWHTEEHMPERVGIPGFLAGRRYDLVDENFAPAAPPDRRLQHCFMMYEGDQLSTFKSDAYLERLNNPTHWTREMAPGFENFSRGACDLHTTSGDGYGGFALLMRFEEDGGEDDLSAATLEALDHFVTTLPGLEGITAAHLGFCRPDITNVDTAEKQSRAGTSEQIFKSVLLIEAYDIRLLVKHFSAIEANLGALGMPSKQARYGFYALSHLLTERTTEEPNKHH